MPSFSLANAPVAAKAAVNPFTGYTAKYTGGGAFGGQSGNQFFGTGNGFQLYDPSGALVDRNAVASGLGLTTPTAGRSGTVTGQSGYNDTLTDFYKSRADADSLALFQSQQKAANLADTAKHKGRIGNFALSAAALAAAPLAGAAAGGLIAGGGLGAAGAGALAGGAVGGGLGYLQGGGKGALTGALTGALGGYAGAGGAGTVGSAISDFTGLGLSGTQAAGLGGALLGAGGGAISGGAKGALLGAGITGLGSYYKAGGFDGILGGDTPNGMTSGNMLTASNSTPVSSGAFVAPSTGTSSYDGALGEFDTDDFLQNGLGGNPVNNSYDAALGSSFDTPSLLSGALSGLKDTFNTDPARNLFSAPETPVMPSSGDWSGIFSNPKTPEETSALGGLLPSSRFSALASPLLSSGIGAYTNMSAADDLIASQEKNRALLSPFLNASFSPGDLENEPGYQFQLKQGTDALNRAQSARGNFFSGSALTAAQDYGQGLAATGYKDAYNRWLSTQGQQLQAAGALANTNTNIGQAQAGSTIGIGNALTQGISGLNSALNPSAQDRYYEAYIKRLMG